MKTVRKVTFHPKTLAALPEYRCRRKVAVYARVSTSSEEQLNSVEAQKDYYTKLVVAHPEWELYCLFSDEGISGTSQKRRDGFNKMLSDAEVGMFTLIITKSISRFARNTVDSLICIRRLKAIGVEVYFEKEDLWTFDSKGEFMLTLLSSMAQDESRSISENVAWGCHKRFSDGKYSVPFCNFLGYDRGKDGEFVVNVSQALIVRLIFKLILEGKTPAGVVNYLAAQNIPSPMGNPRWSQTTVNSILANEKYKGDALLQKRYTVDFLTKRQVPNNGEFPQYYVTDGHEAIIPRKTFDYAQNIIRMRRADYGRRFSGISALSAKIQCADCGHYYGLKSAHSGNLRRKYWVCNNRWTGCGCTTPRIREDRMKAICQAAIQHLLREYKSVMPFAMKLISSSIRADKAYGTKRKRVDSISGCINRLLGDAVSGIEVSDEVLAVIIEKVFASSGSRLVFSFLDGRSFIISV